MFTDSSFNTNYKVDAWGRKIETGRASNDLAKFYEVRWKRSRTANTGQKDNTVAL